MTTSDIKALSQEIQWLQEVIYASFKLYFKNPCEYQTLEELTPPAHNESSYLAEVIKKYDFGFEERIALALALAPNIDSKALDIFFCKNPNTDRAYSEFGGVKGTNHNGFLP